MRWTISAAFLTYVVGGKIAGNDESSEIKVFKELPDKVIPDQAEFLKDKLKLE